MASNWAGFAVNAALTFLMTPFILQEVGTSRYGVWILTQSIIGYYGMLDFGFRNGVTQYLTRYLAIRDYGKASECISSAVVVLTGVGIFLIFLSIAAAYIAPAVFQVPPNVKYEAFWCILIVGVTSGIQFSLMVFSSTFMAIQRFDIANLIGIGTRLLSASMIFIFLRMGHGLIGLSTATCAGIVIDYLIRFFISKRLIPNLKVSFRLFKMIRLREMGSFGIWTFFISLSTYVNQHVPTILIGAFMPVAAVGHYALAAGLFRQINSMLSPVGQVLYPALTGLYSIGDRRGFERLYHNGSRLIMLITIPTVLIGGFWAEDFYRLWVGEEYLSGIPFTSVSILFLILLFANLTLNFSQVSCFVLTSSGRVAILAKVVFLGSIINVVSSIILIRLYGLFGVAFGIVIGSLVVDLFLIPLIIQRELSLSFKKFFVKTCGRPLIAGIFQTLIIILIQFVTDPKDWSHLIRCGFFAFTGALLVIILVGITPSERKIFFLVPLQRLHRKIILFSQS